MLRKIRRTLAVLFFACITLLFLDFTGTLHAWLGWMARVQFLPAVLALNVGVVAALAVLTLLFGRVYCSVVCPLGVFQDLVAWLGGRGKRRKYRFSYSPARRWLRCGTLALFVAALVAGVGLGIWKDLIEATSVLREETRTEPIPENEEVYDRVYALYDKIYLALKDSFKDLSQLR